ncbi:MAG: hypothetical protein HLUCCA12_02515 [Rhodobacteraceae bacterium HLUCCA12]|nr:MAG: hypothetical protein HLUCCA12_02515 [Rhodobacteraceae bacterium HLUCCA12]
MMRAAEPAAEGLAMPLFAFARTTCLIALALAAAALPGRAAAQVIDRCGRMASPASIAEPWAQYSRRFANGAIRIALLDTGGEPVCCAVHLLILSPMPEGPGRQCHVASDAPGTGFLDIDFDGIESSYDPARGLGLDVPVSRWDPGAETGGVGVGDRMTIRINQATGAVTVE